ncbi:MAG: prohibitin family protein [Kiritimatiellae bacterium]|nr:prohibitin family protein [Kiritimatiellia bacterium]
MPFPATPASPRRPSPLFPLLVIAVFLILFAGFGAFGTVPAGHRGVVTRLGRVTGEIKGEGFYMKVPVLDTVHVMDCRIQKEQVTTECSSKDLQPIDTTIALNFSLLPDRSADVFQTIGVDYLSKVISPAMQEGVKAAIARYTSEELVTKREEVRRQMTTLLYDRLAPLGIKTETLNIVNLAFGKAFNAAIEAKVTAEQNALAAKNVLAQREYEAQQLVATARGKADAMKIEAEALISSPQILQLRWLERWDGRLPLYLAGGADSTPASPILALPLPKSSP